jgi:pantothenate kinase/chemotaxis signal transduction protein
MRDASEPALLALADLIALGAGLAARPGRSVLGITGAPGAGKSTLAAELVAALDGRAVLVPLDGFHLDDAVLDVLGRRERKGAPDTFDAAGFAHLLRRVVARTDDVVYAPRFDRAQEQAVAGALPVPRDVPLVVVEGNYLLCDGGFGPVRELLTQCWFLDVDSPTRLGRLVARHIRHGRTFETAQAWVRETDEPNARRIEATRGRADLVLRLIDQTIPAESAATSPETVEHVQNPPRGGGSTDLRRRSDDDGWRMHADSGVAELDLHPASDDLTDLLHVEVDGHRWGLPLDSVVEIHPAVQLAPLPDAPDVVVGLLNRRGHALPVLDLRRRLGLPMRPLQVEDRLVVLHVDDRDVALLVDAALDVLAVPSAAVDRAVTQSADALRSAGVAVLPDGLLVVLDVATFLEPAEVLVLDEALRHAVPSEPA